MTTWTEAYIHALVTDPGSLRDGQKLAQSGQWSGSGQNALAAWGLVQGSGKDPYKLCIDLASGSATKCSCPSRKFPCKHAIGLMLLLAQDKVPASDATPEWVTTWIEGRQRKQEAAPAAVSAKAPDVTAQARREAARQSKVASGVEDLRLFLEDLARQGLEDPRIRTYEFWDRIAGRMVDAQMSPVAVRLRALGGRPFQQRGSWASSLADEIGRLYTLTEAYARLDNLPEALRHDVRAALGFTFKQDEVLASEPVVVDRWHVVGQAGQMVDHITERRTWLYGVSSKRYALLLDFAHASSRFAAQYPIGHSFPADLVYYPSAYPQRALVKQTRGPFRQEDRRLAEAAMTVDDVLQTYAQALARNPFLERIPAGLAQAYPTRGGLVDPSGTVLPLESLPNPQWLQAVMGGDWLPVFGEWDGEQFLMATLVASEGWLPAKSA